MIFQMIIPVILNKQIQIMRRSPHSSQVSMFSMFNVSDNSDYDSDSETQVSQSSLMSDPNQLIIRLVLLDKRTFQFKFSWKKTGKELRRYIYQEISDELEPQLMSIFWKNIRITQGKKLKQYGAPKGVPLEIVQHKLPINNLQGVLFSIEEKDPLNKKAGVVQMSCGHRVGRESIFQIIRAAIADKKVKITCPLVLNCKQWTFEELNKVMIFTKTEKDEVLGGLNKNKLLLKIKQEQQLLKTQTTSQNQPVQPSSTFKIRVVTINNEERQLTISHNTTGQGLKQYIFDNVSDSLHPDTMSLYYQGTKIGKNVRITDIRVVVGTQLKITQHKADITQVANIIADAQGIDQITLEEGVARMECGHNVGRDAMTILVKSLISSNKFEVRCPYTDENDMKCNALWNFKDCRKIGVFTKEETEEFQKGLSMNWMKEFTKQCPRCKEQICKVGLKTNRVVCPSCKFGDFCYMCLKTWKKGSDQYCGNEECKFLEDFLTKAIWNKTFRLYDKKDSNKLKVYVTPQYRACPSCSVIIEHRQACKHMVCSSCTTRFCWVCLSVNKNGNWLCGSYNEYCGKVAQTQKISNF